jgi:uncharacterized protein with HEPN domain
MRRDRRLYLDDILESIELISQYTDGLTEAEFLDNTQVQDSVLRRLEVIGEAVKHLPPALRKDHPEIPWKEIAGSRDILAHEYLGVQPRGIGRTIREDLGSLKQTAEQLRDRVGEEVRG